MESTDVNDALGRVREALARVLDLYAKGAISIRDGSMERALLELARSLRSMEALVGPQEVVRRPYAGLSTEVELLSGLATALRLRMIQVGKVNVSGVEDFFKRLRDVVERLNSALSGGP